MHFSLAIRALFSVLTVFAVVGAQPFVSIPSPSMILNANGPVGNNGWGNPTSTGGYNTQQYQLPQQQLAYSQQQQQQPGTPQPLSSQPVFSSQCSSSLTQMTDWSSMFSCSSYTDMHDAASYPFSVARAQRAAEHGFALQLVHRTTEALLSDPANQIDPFIQDNHDDNDSNWVLVDVQDDSNGHTTASASSTATLSSTAALSYSDIPASLDAIFDAEHSAFTSANSGWSDEAIEVLTDKALCRGMNQPGHLVYCASPGTAIKIRLHAKNMGTKPWIYSYSAPSVTNTPANSFASQAQQGQQLNSNMRIALHEWDAAVWKDPLITPLELQDSKLFFSTASANAAEEEDFYTFSAASESFAQEVGLSLDKNNEQMHLVAIDGVPISTSNVIQHLPTTFTTDSSSVTTICVSPGSTATFDFDTVSPMATGLFPLRFSLLSPCGKLMRPIKVNVELTCSDGVFCNGFERFNVTTQQCDRPQPTLNQPCDDFDECTQDLCDETLGRCNRQIINSTECMERQNKKSSVCGGEKCERFCALDAQCGADGCGGACGMCQVGETCYQSGAGAKATRKCLHTAVSPSNALPSSSLSHSTQAMSQSTQPLIGTCATPHVLDIFEGDSNKRQEWVINPAQFIRGSLQDDQQPMNFQSTSFPSLLSRQKIVIEDLDEGLDEVVPNCVSFGTKPDFIYQFIIPENKEVPIIDPSTFNSNANNNTTTPADPYQPLMMNPDPLTSPALHKVGYVGVHVIAYAKDPRLDTVVEIRGAPGVIVPSSSSSSSLSSAFTLPDLVQSTLKGKMIDPVFSCLEDRIRYNNSFLGHPGKEHEFFLQNSPLEQARQWALGMNVSGVQEINPRPIKPFALCNDNGTPPGGLGSQLSVLLPPGTYYLLISSYPRFNVPAAVQAIQDEAAAKPPPDFDNTHPRQAEAYVRFLANYLPECGNILCGSDGGNNECGLGCSETEECSNLLARCVPTPGTCVPQCAKQNRQCGSDGCGGTCGSCTLASIPQAVSDSTPNLLGIPFTSEDAYCVEDRDPSIEVNRPPGNTQVPVGASAVQQMGSSHCALLPRTCDGTRPICFGVEAVDPVTNQVGYAAGCPADMVCGNDCNCRHVNAPLPDLLVKFDALMNQISLVSMSFSNQSCSLIEHCISRPGLRKLLRFSVAILNQGMMDLDLPPPRSQPNDFLYSPCHHHYHYNHFADYSLIQDGKIMRRGHKQAFCLEDSAQELIGGHVPCLAKHTCTKPGISASWADYYGAELDCQWIDVTDLEPGKYLLRVEVNSARQLLESSFENNAVTVQVTLP